MAENIIKITTVEKITTNPKYIKLVCGNESSARTHLLQFKPNDFLKFVNFIHNIPCATSAETVYNYSLGFYHYYCFAKKEYGAGVLYITVNYMADCYRLKMDLTRLNLSVLLG